MKKLSQKEYDELTREARERLIQDPIIKEIVHNLKMYEHLLIEKKEWKKLSHPGVYLGNYKIRFKKNWTVHTLLNKNGWIVTRVDKKRNNE